MIASKNFTTTPNVNLVPSSSGSHMTLEIPHSSSTPTTVTPQPTPPTTPRGEKGKIIILYFFLLFQEAETDQSLPMTTDDLSVSLPTAVMERKKEEANLLRNQLGIKVTNLLGVTIKYKI